MSVGRLPCRTCDNCYCARCMPNKPLCPDQTAAVMPSWIRVWPLPSTSWARSGSHSVKDRVKTEMWRQAPLSVTLDSTWSRTDANLKKKNNNNSSMVAAHLMSGGTEVGSLSGVDESYPSVIGWVPDCLCVSSHCVSLHMYDCSTASRAGNTPHFLSSHRLPFQSQQNTLMWQQMCSQLSQV